MCHVLCWHTLDAFQRIQRVPADTAPHSCWHSHGPRRLSSHHEPVLYQSMYVHSNDRCQRTAIPDGAFAEQVSSEGAGKELDKVRKEKMLIIRQEEDAAQLSADLTDDAQAQSRTLQDELDERVQLAKASAEAHLQEQLKADMVAEERKRMIDKHEMDVKAMETQLALDTARQQSGMEQQLAARRAKKLRIMEQVPPLVAATDMIATAHTNNLYVCITQAHTHVFKCIQIQR